MRVKPGLLLLVALGCGAVPLAAGAPQGSTAAAPAQPAALTDQPRADFLAWYEKQPTVSVPIDRGSAKVLIVKFNDYQCPPCRETYLRYKDILARYTATGQVRYVLKHFPLERECNAGLQGDLHPAACEAAAAFVMAQVKGTADKLEEWFFANQPSLTAGTVKKAAAEVAGVADYDAQYARALTLVKTDAGLGALLGAKSTPTFFINGRLIAGALPAVAFEAAIEHELRR